MTNHIPHAIMGDPKAPIPPIIVDENGDLDFYPNVEAAERDMEAVDVLDGVYEVFDSAGNRLSVTAKGLMEPVQIQLSPGMTPDPDELARRLRNLVTRLDPERVEMALPETATLPELVDGLARFFRSR